MDLAGKLQLQPSHTLAVLGAPDGVALPDRTLAGPAVADAVLAFLRMLADAEGATAVLRAARMDRIAWFAYPKGGRLGTDLGRDRLVEALVPAGVRPVRAVSIDATWSALRFRPA